ncbi:uncharacterized protein isoform X4 [Salmo salar]|uniref:Uncharacterized protein isoform X4 n=1 Tax=Salmo salar TaxID=8030 RepID=A0ABM3DDP1_SALSA|nr:uncharacterized protein LOC123728708 isoform X4 [Salmo salar]
MTTFHIVLIVIILLKVPLQAFCRVWVDQNPVVTGTLGQKVSMGCRVLSDSGELITGCRAEWYINSATHGQRKCCVNGKDKQYHGNGTRLLISEAKPTPYGLIFTSVIPGAEEENTSEMQLFYFYAFLAVKLLVIIVLGGLNQLLKMSFK